MRGQERRGAVQARGRQGFMQGRHPVHSCGKCKGVKNKFKIDFLKISSLDIIQNRLIFSCDLLVSEYVKTFDGISSVIQCTAAVSAVKQQD